MMEYLRQQEEEKKAVKKGGKKTLEEPSVQENPIIQDELEVTTQMEPLQTPSLKVKKMKTPTTALSIVVHTLTEKRENG